MKYLTHSRLWLTMAALGLCGAPALAGATPHPAVRWVADQDRDLNISGRDPDNIGAVQITPADFTRDNPMKANHRSINDEPSSNNSGRSDINTTRRREESRENPATQGREDQTNTGDKGKGMGAAPVAPSTGQNNGMGSSSGSGNTAPGSSLTIPDTTTPNPTTPGIDTNPAETAPGTNPNPTAPDNTLTPGDTAPGTNGGQNEETEP